MMSFLAGDAVVGGVAYAASSPSNCGKVRLGFSLIVNAWQAPSWGWETAPFLWWPSVLEAGAWGLLRGLDAQADHEGGAALDVVCHIAITREAKEEHLVANGDAGSYAEHVVGYFQNGNKSNAYSV
jgi:hypothetical protein